MAYPAPPEGAAGEEDLKDYLLDISTRKEFRSLLRPADNDNGAAEDTHPYGFGLAQGQNAPDMPTIKGLRLHGAQIFVRNFSNPNTPNTRLLLNWQTGAGKTIGAIAIAQEYIRQFRSRVTIAPADRPGVFVIGFTKQIIQAELLRHPEFGFVSAEEVAELKRLLVASEASNNPASAESRHYNGYLGVLRRRITDRSRGGYYQFYGYKEFANRLFIVTRRGTDQGVTVASLYARGDIEDGDGISDTFLDRIETAVKAGHIEVNSEILDSLRGGLIVADEIHNTYNIQAKNNYGVAIQYALDKYAVDDPGQAPRAVFMSATVTGGSAAEVVDLLNLLIPITQLPGGKRLRREEFFRGRTSDQVTPLPGALDRIGRLSAGRVSFLLDTDEASYPRRIFEGETLADPADGRPIDYLKFTPCPMSPFHARTLARMVKETGSERVAANAYTIYDMAYPNPEFPPGAATKPDSYGLYLSAETPAKLAAAPPEWQTATGISVEIPKPGAPAQISGNFLDLTAKAGIAVYSTKYHAVGSEVLNIIRSGPGKIMIYHQRVRMSGVIQIAELLEMNGVVDSVSSPSPSTLCAVCGVAKRDHGRQKSHAYAPARYIMINSEIDRGTLDRNIAHFNAPSNAEGYEYRIILGSKIIREGFDLKAVRHQLVVSLPTDIPTLIQVFGRAVRKNSHIDLPEDQRDVRIRIFVSTGGPELVRYADKMKAYSLNQLVEKYVRRYATDAYVNYDRMLASNPELARTANIDALPYTPLVSSADVEAAAETTATFEAYGYGEREVEEVRAVIVALFETRPVWTYDDLWAAVRSGRVRGVAQNPDSFTEESFALALDDLGTHSPFVTRGAEAAAMFHKADILISRVGEYYIRAPPGPGGQPVLDVESYVRDNAVLAPVRVRVADYVRTTRTSQNFAVRLEEFEVEFESSETPIEEAFVRYDVEFHHALMRAVVEGREAGELEADIVSRAARQGSPIARAIDLYRRFKILVTAGDVAESPEAKRLAQTTRSLRAGSQAPIGFTTGVAVKIYSGAGGKWRDIPRKALGIGARYVENDVVVGYIERRGSNLRFKVRPPIQELSAADVRDIRSLARGAVCETRPRSEQENLALQLKVDRATSRKTFEGYSSAELCRAIRSRLLDLEEASRNRKNGMLSGLRWFYLLDEILPPVSLAR